VWYPRGVSGLAGWATLADDMAKPIFAVAADFEKLRASPVTHPVQRNVYVKCVAFEVLPVAIVLRACGPV
jgi:hypothetical protein